MTPSGIEPATFRFVAQHLNHCATAVPGLWWCNSRIYTISVNIAHKTEEYLKDIVSVRPSVYCISEAAKLI